MDILLCRFFNHIYAFGIEVGKNATEGYVVKKCMNKLDRMNRIDWIQVARSTLFIQSIPSNVCPFNIEDIKIIRKYSLFELKCACVRLYIF